MRIIALYSPIVTMLTTVIYDLKEFILFYFILVGMMSLCIGVLGNGNPNVDINPSMAIAKAKADLAGESFNGSEYGNLPMLIINVLETLKVSTGDFGSMIAASIYLNNGDNSMFWMIFVVIVTITSIIFLNFIIAEASASYEKVAGQLESYITKQKA